MPGKGIRTCRVIKCLMRNDIGVGKHGIVTATENGVRIIRQEIPNQTVPSGKHHIFCSLVNRHEVIRKQIPCTKTVYIEILTCLRLELLRVVLTSYNPTIKPCNGVLLIFGCRCPSCIRGKTELQTVVKLRHIISREQAQLLRVVQELEAHTRVGLIPKRCFVIEALYALKTVNNMAVALFIVEVELAEVLVCSAVVVVVEAIAREAVNGNTHVIISLVRLLRWSEETALFPNIVYQAYSTRIVR